MKTLVFWSGSLASPTYIAAGPNGREGLAFPYTIAIGISFFILFSIFNLEMIKSCGVEGLTSSARFAG